MPPLTTGPLQSGVAYMAPALAGAFNANVPYNIDSWTWEVDLPVGTLFPYGAFVVRGTSGITLPTIDSEVGDIVGVVAYGNNGVTQDAGFVVGGLYDLIPVLNFGRIWVPVTTDQAISVGDVVGLNLNAGPDFNTVYPLSAGPVLGVIDISAIARVSQEGIENTTTTGLVEITLTHYID